MAYGGMKMYKEAISDYNQAIKLDPKWAKPYNNRGLAYFLLKQFQNTIDDCTTAIKLDPKLIIAYINRGFAYQNLGQFQQGLADMNRAVDLDRNSANSYGARARLEYRWTKYPDTIRDYTKAIELGDNNYGAYDFRGCAYFMCGEFDKAIDDFDRAISVSERMPAPYNNKGWALLAKNDKAEAIEYFKKAIERQKEKSSFAFSGLSTAYQLQGLQKLSDDQESVAKQCQDYHDDLTYIKNFRSVVMKSLSPGGANQVAGSGSVSPTSSQRTDTQATAGGAKTGAINRPIHDKWAVVVGISEFEDKEIQQLHYPAKDARDFANFLITSGGFTKDHVRLILNKEATRSRIVGEIAEFFLPRVAGPDDLVVI
jgi:Flp pilus assembly protein TadD